MRAIGKKAMDLHKFHQKVPFSDYKGKHMHSFGDKVLDDGKPRQTQV